MLSAGSAALYVARWAANEEAPHELAPSAGWSRTIFRACPPAVLRLAFLFPRLAALVAWVLAPHLLAEEITDGNVNFSYRVTGRAGRSVFIKQAMAFVKWQPQMPLEAERMLREVSYFDVMRDKLGETLARRFLPEIYHFDQAESILIMEFLDTYSLLFNQLFDTGALSDAAAAALGEYLGHAHSATLGREAAAGSGCERAHQFWNPSMRKIQLEHVYTICFERSAKGARLAADKAFMAEVDYLKAKYLGYSHDALDQYVLCHGDFHPGSVMVDPTREEGIKVIDPEFTVYGPPGLDAGSLLSGFVLAFLYRELRARGGGAALLAAIDGLWRAYASRLSAEGMSDAHLRRVEEDTVGFCTIEVLRTSLGFAGARDPHRRVAEPDGLERYQLAALQVVSRCLMGRRGAKGGMTLLLSELQRVDLSKM
ncbi:hypothetical protein AB1Y20_017221 [Prymnesium parvum]|uniref:Aminoglycoside phosphotransferase domain-containing protein n=1 Tax=Prymnesium parvum TaxID=97485 RepID=A0AB34IB15_PRYPA